MFINKKYNYKPSEEVKLEMRLKNIDKLKVRVFEVHTVNFLIEKKQMDFTKIDLSGLIPFEEYEY